MYRFWVYVERCPEFAWENSLTGLEFAIGIPGTLGGAVFMNSGAYDGEMSHVVTAVRAVDFQGNIKEYDASHLDFGYRHSVFHDNHEVIGEVIMTLKPGDKNVIKARMDELYRETRVQTAFRIC